MAEKAKFAYLIGIKGVGMTALAVYLKQAGFEVEGSDSQNIYMTDEVLKKAQIKVYEGFAKENLQNKSPDLCIISAAYGFDNPEAKEVRHRKIKTMYYSEALGSISAEKKLIAVAGIHGKTTTTALVASMLKAANLDPSFIIGAAAVPILGTCAQYGTGEYFVLEADEYRQSPSNNSSKFLDLNPEIAVITSIEFDHPDIFPTVEEVYQTFYRFACRVPRHGSIILCLDYPKCRKLKSSLVDRHFETYGFDSEAAWRIVGAREGGQTEFSLEHDQETFGPYTLKIPGQHNILNATVAVILAKKFNIDEKIIKKVLNEFSGVGRRFEKVGAVGDIQIFDDYAHHPTAIQKTLEATRAKFPKAKIWCVFQPHTYSRTKSLLKEFGKAFNLADKVVITDIYASERETTGDVTARDLVKEIEKNQKNVRNVRNVRYFKNQEEIKKYLIDFVKGPAIILMMGAGDIYKLSQDLIEELQK